VVVGLRGAGRRRTWRCGGVCWSWSQTSQTVCCACRWAGSGGCPTWVCRTNGKQRRKEKDIDMGVDTQQFQHRGGNDSFHLRRAGCFSTSAWSRAPFWWLVGWPGTCLRSALGCSKPKAQSRTGTDEKLCTTKSVLVSNHMTKNLRSFTSNQIKWCV